MKLLRLEIQGFKSFKDKTLIHFDEGITGIVGPNGCGKSNIVDALFWVMGEQSAKHLRGNKMKDLIFAGSSKYAPASWAEVTLVLLNDTGKHIHIGSQVVKPQEIALTRKLYRNGETEYRINGIPARLRDIHEVFMDTGAGAKSYSIIAQGEINRLVQAKPQERRTMIEEVAGITKFKIRKRESLKKIEHTQSNLNRLDDLQTEIYKNLKNLEHQAEKAERARVLKEKIKKHELISKSHKEFDYLTDFVNASDKLKVNDEELERATLEKEQLELALTDERIKKTDIMEKVDGLQAEYNEMSRELAAKEERLKHLKSGKEEREKRIVEKARENEELQNDIESRRQKLSEIEAKIEELESTNYEQIDFTEQTEAVEILKESIVDKEEAFNDLASQMEDHKATLNELNQKLFRNNSKLEEYATSLEDISKEIEEIESNYADYSDELVQQREDLNVSKKLLLETEKTYKEKKVELEEKSRSLKELDAALRTLSTEVIQLESKRQSLIEVNKTGEGVKEGAVKFINDSETTSFEILGNLIESESTYAKALEILFESTFDSLISKSANTEELTKWYGENKESSFDLVMTSNQNLSSEATIERLRLKGCENIIAVSDILTVNKQDYKETLKNFFNGFYIVKNFSPEVALQISTEINFRGIVSLDGSTYLLKTINGLKLSVRTEDDIKMGVVQRNNLIAELTASLEEKKTVLDQMEADLATLDERVSSLQIETSELNIRFNELNTKVVGLKSSLESREDGFGSTSARLKILAQRKTEISGARLDLIESDEKLQNELSSTQETYESLENSYADLKDELSEIKATYEEKRSELLELQANAKTFQAQIDSYNSQKEDILSQIQKYNEKTEANNIALEQAETQLSDALSEIDQLAEENQGQAEIMAEKDQYLSLVKDELTSLLVGMQEREDRVKALNSIISKIEKLNVELNLKIEQTIIDEEILVKDIFDRYRVDLRDSLATFLEILPDKIDALADTSGMYIMEGEEGPITIKAEAYIFDKKFPGVVKESKEKFKKYNSDLNRLGTINWQAVEEYERQKLRYDFLKMQQQELKNSLDELTLAIEHIDEKSKERFKIAFNEVNERFTKVFPIIFGGGEARLDIVGELDDIECGIEIIAKPPGKKMQSINLMSGGEKAMTAVSLIFSIFLVKPSPFCLLDEVDAPLDDANVGRFNELLREMSSESQFILITHNKKTMELNDTLYGVTMQEPGVSKAVSVQLQ